jgi:AraC-like DNA-binding protein
VYSLKNRKYMLKIDYLHFTPAIFTYVYLIPFYFFYSSEEKAQVDKGLVDDFSLFSNLILIGFIISGITYSIVAYKKLLQHNKIVEDNFSYNSRINMNWLRYSILGIGAVFVTVALVSVVRELLGFQFPFNADILFYSIIVAFVVFVGYSGIRQQDLFSNVAYYENEVDRTEREYKKSGLKSETAMSKHGELLKVMETEKPFLNPKLTLPELAQNLSVSPNHLSQIINQYEQVNFYDFINKYRVEEFVQRAQHNKSFSFLAHALDSGFNSKSSFNSVFKKFKSMTPSQYIASLNK